MEVVRFLAQAPRPAGGAREDAVLAFLQARFHEIGLPVRREQFAFRSWESSGEWTLALGNGSGAIRLPAVPLPYTSAHHGSPLSGSVEWEGNWPLIPGRLLCPRFVLRDRDQIVAAIVGMPDGAPRPLPNPNPLFSLPTIVIGAEEADHLKELTGGAASVPGRIEGGSVSEDLRRSFNVVAGLAGPARHLALVAHYDCVEGSPGANDNASGVAVLLRLAERFAASEGRTGFRFILAGAEEPFLAGSRSYVGTAAMTGALEGCVAVLNLDMVAVGERFSLRCVPRSFWAEVAGALPPASKAGVPVVQTGLYAASDHWAFHEVGIASAQLTREADPQWHSPADEVDRFGEMELADAEDLAAQLVAEAHRRLEEPDR